MVKLNKSKKNIPDSPKNASELIQMIRLESPFVKYGLILLLGDRGRNSALCYKRGVNNGRTNHVCFWLPS